MNNTVSNSRIGVRATLPDIVTQYDAAIFFDNEQKHIDAVQGACPTLKCVKIPQTSDKLQKIRTLFTQSPFKEYVASLGPNEYFETLKHYPSAMQYELYDPVSGIQAAHIPMLHEWVDMTRVIEKRVAVFDWDRTLTIMEGFLTFANIDKVRHIYPAASSWNVFVQHTALYLFGGPVRLQVITDMFAYLAAQGVDIIVLTNNGSCPSKIHLMANILDLLAPPGKQIYIYCSAPYPYSGNKGVRLLNAASFKHTICKPMPATVGGRSRRRRQSYRKRTRRAH